MVVELYVIQSIRAHFKTILCGVWEFLGNIYTQPALPQQMLKTYFGFVKSCNQSLFKSASSRGSMPEAELQHASAACNAHSTLKRPPIYNSLLQRCRLSTRTAGNHKASAGRPTFADPYPPARTCCIRQEHFLVCCKLHQGAIATLVLLKTGRSCKTPIALSRASAPTTYQP